ncbi:MAG: serine protease [Pseudonocardiales bacterium]|nr:serine protease [Pseudonocardiales bacterium]
MTPVRPNRWHAIPAVSLLIIGLASIDPSSASAAPATPEPGKPALRHALQSRQAATAPIADKAALAAQRALRSAQYVVLVAQLAPSANAAKIAAQADSRTVTLRHTLGRLHAVSVQVPRAQAAEARARLAAIPGVAGVKQSASRSFSGTPNDPSYTQQSGYYTAVNAPAAWDVQHGSAAVKIAVIDSGVDIAQPDLSGKVVSAYNAVDGTADVTDTLGHGTFVAGVAAANTDNAVGVAGAGYNSSLMAVKIAAADDTFSSDDEAAGILWAADHGASIINLSLGGYTSDPTESNAIAYAESLGVVVVAAAGNDATSAPFYPAAYPGVVAVGATDADHRANFSNSGAWVTLAAPGVNIYSTTPTAGSTLFPSNYASGSGTSFSTPLVAGAAALLRAANPSATAATIRSALVAGSHGYAGLGLGAGQLDFASALGHLPPTSTPSAVSVSGTADVVTLQATSAAPKVRFQLDSGTPSVPVAVTSGTASLNLASWGYVNGNHSVTAFDCTATGECAAAGNATSFDLENAGPQVTSPVDQAAITGGFTIQATSTGGGLQLLVDGSVRGFDASSPYAFAYSGSALSDGTHTIQVRQCSVDGTRCAGPQSSPNTITSHSLHPTISSISPNPFGPNGNHVKDTTRVSFSLPDAEQVTVSVLTSSGTVVRGPGSMGTLAKGPHSWTWDGRANQAGRLSDSTYTVQLSTSRGLDGATVRGLVTKTVRLDNTAPTYSSTTGSGAHFYPYHDGYADSFSPGTKLSESGQLKLEIRTAKGQLIRTITASRSAGHATLSWTGRTSSGKALAAGTYTWRFVVTDVAGNTRVSPNYHVTLSLKKLVARSTVIRKNGDAITFAGGSAACAGAFPSASDFAHGVELINVCDPSQYGLQLGLALYRFKLPSATRYSQLAIHAYGFSFYFPSSIEGAFFRAGSDLVDVRPSVTVGTAAHRLYSLGTVGASGHYDASHVAEIGVSVDDSYNDSVNPSDFDLAYVELTVTYYVLG